MRVWPRPIRCSTASTVPCRSSEPTKSSPMPGDLARELHQRHLRRHQVLQRLGRGAAGRADDHAVGAIFLERGEDSVLPLQVLGIGPEQDRAAMRGRRFLDRREQLGEIGIGDVVEADAEDIGPVGPQRSRTAIVAIAHLAGDLLHPQARAVGDQRAFAQSERDRRGRDLQPVGDDLQGNATSATRFDARLTPPPKGRASVRHSPSIASPEAGKPMHSTSSWPNRSALHCSIS
jgi:hypothetical protein